jgi:hypothetical protein
MVLHLLTPLRPPFKLQRSLGSFTESSSPSIQLYFIQGIPSDLNEVVCIGIDKQQECLIVSRCGAET